MTLYTCRTQPLPFRPSIATLIPSYNTLEVFAHKQWLFTIHTACDASPCPYVLHIVRLSHSWSSLTQVLQLLVSKPKNSSTILLPRTSQNRSMHSTRRLHQANLRQLRMTRRTSKRTKRRGQGQPRKKQRECKQRTKRRQCKVQHFVTHSSHISVSVSYSGCCVCLTFAFAATVSMCSHLCLILALAATVSFVAVSVSYSHLLPL